MPTYQLKVTKPTLALIITILGALTTWITATYGTVPLAANAVVIIGAIVAVLIAEEQAMGAGASITTPSTNGNLFIWGAVAIFSATALVSVVGFYGFHFSFTWDVYEEVIGLVFGFVVLILGMIQEGEL